MNTTTEEIKTVETEQEAAELMREHFENIGKKSSRADAVAYREKLLAARAGKNFKEVRNVWNSLGYKRFSKRDYLELIKPLINEDVQLVEQVLTKAKTAKNIFELKKFSRLSRPVVPTAYRTYKMGIQNIGISLLTQSFSNKVVIATK